MKKIIKKLLTITCCFVLCLVCLTGCSWLKIDNYRYYNQVVASIGDKEFTKKDLITAYNNYGYQYTESYGYSMEQGIEATIDAMIDRYLLLEHIKSLGIYDIYADENAEELLKIKVETFDYMQDSIFSYEKQVRKEWNMTIDTEDEEEEDKESLRAEETSYSPKTYFENGVVYRVEDEKEEVLLDGSITKDTHFSKSMQVVTNKKVSDEAWSRYIKKLQDTAKDEGRKTGETEVLLHEEKKLEEQLINNWYLERYQEDFYKNYSIDTEKVLSYYKTNFLAQKDDYKANESLYHTAMKDASKNLIYYHPNSGNEYVNVKHILIKFSDAQTKAIEALDTEKENNNITEAEYDAKYNKIIAQTTSKFEMNGVEYTWNAINSTNGDYSVWDYVQSKVTGSTLKERAEQFNELVYIFNDDEGFMNSEFDYVVNLDTEVEDQMVKPFADGVRALDASNGGKGAGSMDYIISEYGIHIIFHAGNATNIVNENNINNISSEELLRLLCTTYTTPESNKSIFNYIYDKLNLDSSAYDDKSENDINTIKTNLKNNGVELKLYKDNYKDMYE